MNMKSPVRYLISRYNVNIAYSNEWDRRKQRKLTSLNACWKSEITNGMRTRSRIISEIECKHIIYRKNENIP